VSLRGVAAPHLLAAALCTGLAAANATRAPGSLVAALALLLALCGFIAPPRARLALLAASLASAGLWWGTVRLETLDGSALAPKAGQVAPTVAVVTGPARHSRFAVRAPAEVRRFGRLTLREPVLLSLPPGRGPPQGSVVRLIGRVELPRTGATGFDERAWLRRSGVQVVIRAASSRWRIVGRRGGFWQLADRLHAGLLDHAAQGLHGSRRGVIAGIVLGEDEELPADLRRAFRASGLYHLLAVSGQNVAFLAAGILGVAWLLGLPRWLGELGTMGTIGAYVLAVGWQPSVVRAAVAGCLASLAWLAARPRDRWHFLLLGAIVLLAWNPYMLRDPGFQLSFAAVAAIFVLVPRVEDALAGYPVPRGLADALAVSAACAIATAPILWFQFGAVPLYSIVANALAAPVVGPLLGLGLLSALAAPVAPGAAAALAWVNGWFAAYLAATAEAVAAFPHAQLMSGAAIAAGGLALAAAVGARRLSGPSRRIAVGAAVAAVVVAAGWRLYPQPPAPPPKGLRISFLDVGQGDAVLVQTATAAMLVDEGPPEADVAHQLRRLGVRRLALLVLTHPQRDHVGGAADVLRHVGVDRVLDPRIPFPSPSEHAALAAARVRNVPIDVARAGREYRIGRLRIRILWPSEPGAPYEDPNQHAVVLVVSYGEIDALLTADAESDVTVPLRPPPVEIMKVGHHGSADELLPELLTMTHPRVAVISVGEGNPYGHPAPSTLATLDAVPGLRIYRTDRDGRVVVESDGHALSVRTEP
jgi:competence protein ComEC